MRESHLGAVLNGRESQDAASTDRSFHSQAGRVAAGTRRSAHQVAGSALGHLADTWVQLYGLVIAAACVLSPISQSPCSRDYGEHRCPTHVSCLLGWLTARGLR